MRLCSWAWKIRLPETAPIHIKCTYNSWNYILSMIETKECQLNKTQRENNVSDLKIKSYRNAPTKMAPNFKQSLIRKKKLTRMRHTVKITSATILYTIPYVDKELYLEWNGSITLKHIRSTCWQGTIRKGIMEIEKHKHIVKQLKIINIIYYRGDTFKWVHSKNDNTFWEVTCNEYWK